MSDEKESGDEIEVGGEDGPSNVYSLFKREPIPQAKINKALVGLLEYLLGLAQEGRLCGIAAVAFAVDGRMLEVFKGDVTAQAGVYGVTALYRKFMSGGLTPGSHPFEERD